MRTVPRRNQKKLSFFEIRLQKWADNAEAIGTTPQIVATLTQQTEDARAAFKAQQRALSVARTATAAYNQLLEEMANTGSSVLLQIRSKAGSSGDPNVYSLASISPPADASPIAPPGKPTRFSFTVDAIGAIDMRWECKNPRGSSGTMYKVSRSVAGGEFEPLGIAGKKKFRDETVPAGASRIVYRVQAIRSTGAGDEALFNVSFGGTGRMSGRQIPRGMKRAA